MILGYPKSTGIPRVDRLSTGPPDLECHSLVSGLRLTINPPVFSNISLSYLSVES